MAQWSLLDYRLFHTKRQFWSQLRLIHCQRQNVAQSSVSQYVVYGGRRALPVVKFNIIILCVPGVLLPSILS